MTSSQINKEWRLIASSRLDSQEGWCSERLSSRQTMSWELQYWKQELDHRILARGDFYTRRDVDVLQDKPGSRRKRTTRCEVWGFYVPRNYQLSNQRLPRSWSAPCATQRRKRVFSELGPVFQRRTSVLDPVELDPASAESYVFGEWWWKSAAERQSPEFTQSSCLFVFSSFVSVFFFLFSMMK